MTSNQITFRVPDMSCAHCVNTITTAIKTAFESVEVEADLANHLVTIRGTQDRDRIATVIAEQDYHCEPL